ncbi:hypothetical protein ACFU3J_16245 [Streptomyces sp. NPDC057411]|uniref:hypothetical protein n=1 Tax=unclassified Streptomyces TaxID=2593676 RepID=UPI00362F8E4C
MTTTQTVLDTALETHGRRCGCEGACGSHRGNRCEVRDYQRPLHAAPYPPRTTDAANAGVPASELRPWCPRCWHRALKAERDRAAQERLTSLQDAQLGLFDPAVLDAG